MEIVLGGLLLVSSVLGPIGMPLEPSDTTGNFSAVATFPAANYTGQAEMTTHEGVVLLDGSLAVVLDAQQVSVTIFHRKEAELDVRAQAGGMSAANEWRAWAASEHDEDRFENATIEIESQRDGRLRLWPGEGDVNETRFSLDLTEAATPTISASSLGPTFTDGPEADHHFPAPIVDLGHRTDNFKPIPLEEGRFAELQVHGSLNLLVDDAYISVEAEANERSYDTADGLSFSDTTDTMAARERVFAVLSIESANMSTGFEGLSASMFAYEPTWRINGSLTFDAVEGHLSTGLTNRTLTNDTVEVSGRSVAHLTPWIPERDGLLSEAPVGGTATGFSRPPAQIDAELEGDPDRVEVNGEALATSSSDRQIPEEVTFWAQILGALLLAWSLLKKIVPFSVGLLSGDPLANDRRRAIHAFLEDVGFAHVREIERATDIPVASLSYHLRVLRECGLLVKVEQGGYTVYYPVCGELSQEEREDLALLADPTRRDIASQLVQHGSLCQDELVRALDVARSTISRQLAKLAEAGLVEENGNQNIRYKPTGLLEKWAEIA